MTSVFINGVKTAATATQNVNKEAIRLLVLEMGYDLTASKTGIKPATLRKWAERGQWWTQEKPSKALVTNVTRPSQVLVDELQENERETKLSLSRYARRAAKDAEQCSLKESPFVHKAAQVAGLVHRWGEEKSEKQFTLNVLNINSLQIDGDQT